jgi:hypothetical protein
MRFEKPFREIYIRLAENEPVFVCTPRYFGFRGKPIKVPFKSRSEKRRDPEEESLPFVWVRGWFGKGARDGFGEE